MPTAIRRRYRQIIFDYYGWVCQCCGLRANPNTPEAYFLTIDHQNNDGHHRQSDKHDAHPWSELADLILRGRPKQGLRVLCWNCNCGRQINGGICPHQDKANLFEGSVV